MKKSSQDKNSESSAAAAGDGASKLTTSPQYVKNTEFGPVWKSYDHSTKEWRYDLTGLTCKPEEFPTAAEAAARTEWVKVTSIKKPEVLGKHSGDTLPSSEFGNWHPDARASLELWDEVRFLEIFPPFNVNC